MPFSIVGFYESQTATALSLVAAVVTGEDSFQAAGDDITVPSNYNMLLGSLHAAVSTPKYMEVRQPKLATPYRNYNAGLLATSQDMIAGFRNRFPTPLPLYAGDKINVAVQNATAEVSMVALWLGTGWIKTADVEAVRPTHEITGYADCALTAGIWNDVAIEWDQKLPKGTYAVVGMNVGTYKAAAPGFGVARLLLKTQEGKYWRPGVLLQQCTGDKTIMADQDIDDYSAGRRWPLMREITLTEELMPDIQILASDANTDHVVNLLLQKIG